MRPNPQLKKLKIIVENATKKAALAVFLHNKNMEKKCGIPKQQRQTLIMCVSKYLRVRCILVGEENNFELRAV